MFLPVVFASASIKLTCASSYTDSRTSRVPSLGTTVTTTSTTTVFSCNSPCLNQSWLNPTGVIALWAFEGSFNDATNTYNGAPSSNPPTFVTGYLGQAAAFDASTQQAIYTPFIPLVNMSFTVEVWIKLSGYIANQTEYSIVGLCQSKTLDLCLHINIRSTKLYFGLYRNDTRGTTVIPVAQWIHAAFVFDFALKVSWIYLNGFVDGQASITSGFLASSGNFTIGTNQLLLVPNNYFNVRRPRFFSNYVLSFLHFVAIQTKPPIRD